MPVCFASATRFFYSREAEARANRYTLAVFHAVSRPGVGATREPRSPARANHQYDNRDFFDALAAANLPAVSFLKVPAYVDGMPVIRSHCWNWRFWSIRSI